MKRQSREELKRELKKRVWDFVEHYMDKDVEEFMHKIVFWRTAFFVSVAVLVATWVIVLV